MEQHLYCRVKEKIHYGFRQLLHLSYSFIDYWTNFRLDSEHEAEPSPKFSEFTILSCWLLSYELGR
jgi:hypothetical protein